MKITASLLQVVDRSGVVRVSVGRSEDAASALVPLNMMGTREAVDNAQFLLRNSLAQQQVCLSAYLCR